MTIGVPSFDEYAHAVASAPEGYALYQKEKARRYIRDRNACLAFVRNTLARSDLTDAQKITVLKFMNPWKDLK